MSYGAPTYTVQDVFSRAMRTFGDESGVQLETTDLLRWINDGQRDIVQRESILKAKSSVMSTAGVASYSWPAENILSIDSLHYDGQKIANMSFAQAEQDVIGDQPSNTADQPIIWYEWAGQFTFYPIPETSKQITIYFTKAPAAVTAPTDLLSIPDRYFNSLLQYVLQQAYEMDEDWQASDAKSKQYNESLAILSDGERTAQNMTYGTITEIWPY